MLRRAWAWFSRAKLEHKQKHKPNVGLKYMLKLDSYKPDWPDGKPEPDRKAWKFIDIFSILKKKIIEF